MYGSSSIHHSSVVLCGGDVYVAACQFAPPPLYCVVCAWCAVCSVRCAVWGVRCGGDACVAVRQFAPPPLYRVVCAWCVLGGLRGVFAVIVWRYVCRG